MTGRVIKSTSAATDHYGPFERECLEPYVPATDPDVGQVPELTAEDILEAARQEAETKVREAYTEGARRGEQAGRDAFDETVAGVAEALRAAAATMQEAHARFLDSLEPQMVALAGQIAERILRREIQTDPDLLHRTSRAALKQIANRARLTIRLNPEDLARLREQNVTLLDEFDEVMEVTTIADESVDSGGCIVENEAVTVDARIHTQLQQILDGLLE